MPRTAHEALLDNLRIAPTDEPQRVTFMTPEGTDVVIIADGWKKSHLTALLSSGDLPGFSEWIDRDGVLIPDVVSNIPTVSVASHASILTGRYQQDHEIPAHRWRSNDGCGHNYLSALGPRSANRDLSANVETIFERYHDSRATISVQGIIERGADQRVRVLSSLGSRILSRASETLTEQPRPAVASIWLPRVDGLSHVYGDSDWRVKDEMRKTSIEFDRFMTRLTTSDSLGPVRVLFAPDHGHREVSKRTDLSALLARCGIYASVNPKFGRGHGPAAFTSGDSSAFLYLGSKLENDDSLLQSVAAHPDLSVVCRRDSPESATVFGQDGVGRAQVLPGRFVQYTVEGRDPLRRLADQETATVSLDEPDVEGPYPSFLGQYLQSFVPNRSGRVVAFAAASTHFGTGPRLGYRFGLHRGTHGSITAEEVVVAAMAFGVGKRSLEPVASANLLRRLGMLSAGLPVSS